MSRWRTRCLLKGVADDAQAAIYKLQADRHDIRYYR
jgi:hypothetical protein